MFELGRFITEELEKREIKRSEFVQKLGYSNINKGLRALDICIRKGTPHPFVVQNLHKAFKIERSTIERILETTKQQRLDMEEEIKRKHFKPHLWIITERTRPTSITNALFSGMTEKRVGLPPDVSELTLEDQLEFVSSVAKEHYLKNKGEWPFFGKIAGYYFFYRFRENVRLDVDGIVEKRETTSFEEPEGYLMIGGRRIPPLFKLRN